MAGTDWLEWHRPYDDPGSPLSRRLAEVQRSVAEWLDRAPPGALGVVSVCAGQGRDLVGALAGHPRRLDVGGRLVELDRRNVAVARRAVAQAGLGRLRAVEGDGSFADAYRGAVPADLVLLCGVLGNVADDGLPALIGALPELCAPGATVIWTRHRRPPDRTPDLRRRFAEHGFDELAFSAPDGFVFSVGVHRLAAPPRPLVAGRRLFRFDGDGSRPA